MKEEAKAEEVRKSDIVFGLRSVGIKKGDVVMVHSSLSSMGWVVGGAETVIEAFWEVLSSKGTVVVPTLCQRDKERRFETWDIEKSPSDVGRITETLRLDPRSLRSDHPTHSVAAIGAKAVDITIGHKTAHGRMSPWGDAAFGKGSPWEKLYEYNAQYLFLGVGFSVNTMHHFIQAVLVEKALNQVKNEKVQKELGSQVQDWRKECIWPNYDDTKMESILDDMGLTRHGQIGKAEIKAIYTRDMVDKSLEILIANPSNWFSNDFLNWYYACQKYGGK